jgi:hypothetical protein
MNVSTVDSVEIGECRLTPYSITKQFFTKVWINEAVEVKVMLDSGSAGNFISPRSADAFGLIRQPRDTPLSVTHFQGKTIGVVTEQVTCTMRKGTHVEQITLDVVPLGKHAIIIGMPWLQVHNPHLDWVTRKVTFGSEYCKENCIGFSEEDTEELEIMEISVVSEQEKSSIPEDYHDLLETFDIERAQSMPKSRGVFDFKIDLTPGAELPRPAKPYHLTPAQMDKARSQLRELEEAGMIAPSDSPMAAPLFFVPKKDGGHQMCIDYHKLNAITVRDAYPLPNMEALLEAARGSKVFSKFDLRSAYNMFPIRREDRWKMGFVTPWGLYEFNVMHYGFVNAPPCLQRYMDHILVPLIYQQPAQVTVYMDDIGSFAKDTEEAVCLNRQILQTLGRVGLYCKASKCDFHKDEIELLGVTVNGKGFRLEEKKVMDVRDWPVPTNLKEMKGFIGFCNFYRRFLKNFSMVARPLHDLDKRDKPWEWGPEQQRAFDDLKELISSEPCLAHADLNKTFQMETDASNFAYGAALTQKQEDGKYHPVGFMSKSMVPAERNYDAYDREALGIVKPLQHWRYWLEGTQKPIEIITDHKNLLSSFNDKPTPSKRHLRWLKILRQYNYVVGYRPGSKNTVADILSRRADHYPPNGEESECTNPFPEEKILPLEELESATMDAETAWEHGLLCLIDSDTKFLEEIESLVMETDPKGEEGRIWVPPLNDLRRRIVELYHDTPLTGHLGITGTYELVTRGYMWEGIHDYITKYVTFCSTCIRAKKWNYKLHGTLKPLPIPEGPWQWTESDHIVKLPKSKGYDSIYVVVDRFTKMAHFIPTTEKASEDDLIDLHMRNVWKLHGMPLIHSTDRHGNFTSKYIWKMFKALGIEQRFSTAYHPQTQGQVENLNGWLETYLRMFCDHQKRNWASLLHTAEFAWNNHHHSSLGMTPFYANSGMHPTTTDVPSMGQTDTVGRITRIHESRELAKALLVKAQEEQKVTYDR